jgi:hypothetical protein
VSDANGDFIATSPAFNGWYGIQGVKWNDNNQFFQLAFKSTGTTFTTNNIIAGWAFDSTKLSNGTDIQLDSANKSITIANQSFGSTGIQLEYNSGTPRAFIGKNDGGFVKFTGTDLEISSSAFFLGSATQFISGSTGNIEISSSNFHLQPDGDVIMSGTVTATAGQIGGFAITSNAISSSNGDLQLKSNGQITGSNVLFSGGEIGGFDLSSAQINSTNNNLILKDSGQITGSNVLFDGGEIGGFAIDGHSLTTTGVEINDVTQTLFISSSNFKVTHDGDVTGSNFLFQGGKITGEVAFENAPFASVIYFDDFSSYSSASAVEKPDDPQTDGSGQGYYNNSGTGEISFISGDGEIYGGRAFAIGNNSGNDQKWYSSNKLIPFNETSLYEYEIRMKSPTGDTAYAGVTAFASDGTTKVNISGADSYGSQHYFALSGTAVGTDWTIYKGYFKGVAASGAGGSHSDLTDPGLVNDGALNGYIAPMFIVNYSGQPGTTYIDYIKITEFGSTGGGTRISGDSIKTGKVQSNNLSTTEGSELDLNAGTITLGGTSDPSFAVSATGDLTASNALFDGDVTAVNFSERIITIDNDNSGSYLRYISGDATTGKKNIVFDGSLGGEIMMNCVINVDDPFTISDIELANTGSDTFNNVRVIIQTQGMTFDDASVSSGTGEAYQVKL